MLQLESQIVSFRSSCLFSALFSIVTDLQGLNCGNNCDVFGITSLIFGFDALIGHKARNSARSTNSDISGQVPQVPRSMEASKALSIIQNDILGIIIEYAGIGSLGNLWCSGDRILLQKLAFSVKMCYHHGVGHDRVPFPKCIRHLTVLEEILFDMPYLHSFDTTDFSEAFMQSIPSSITKLKITAPHWFSFWLPNNARFKDEIVPPSTKTIMKYTNNQKISLILEQRFPKLRVLELTTKATYAPDTNFFEFVDLPSSLTRIWLPYYSNPSIFPCLPISLVELSLGINTVQESDLLLLSGLTSLQLLDIPVAGDLTVSNTRFLPPSLTILNATLMEGHTKEQIDILPRGLQSLKFFGCGCLKHASSLPRGLTRLDVYVGMIEPTTREWKFSEICMALPRTLKTLLISSIGNEVDEVPFTIDPSDFQCFPPHLETIQVPLSKWTSPYVQALPRTITSLYLYTGSMDDGTLEQILRVLPPNLKSLTFPELINFDVPLKATVPSDSETSPPTSIRVPSTWKTVYISDFLCRRRISLNGPSSSSWVSSNEVMVNRDTSLLQELFRIDSSPFYRAPSLLNTAALAGNLNGLEFLHSMRIPIMCKCFGVEERMLSCAESSGNSKLVKWLKARKTR